jgi:hypothetical protein
MVERAVYSFWSNPSNDEHVGFNSEEAFINCLYLSVLYSKKHFKEVVLVTDNAGKKMLIEKYQIPFDSCSTELNELATENKKHWSIGKIKACAVQKKPFVHIDNDVILFKKLPAQFLMSPVGFQSFEGNFFSQYYSFCMDDLKLNWNESPKWLDSSDYTAYNCGIMLFNDLRVLDEWYLHAKKYINYVDKKLLEGFDFGGHLPCLIFEQVFIKHLLNLYKIPVIFLSSFYNNENIQCIDDDLAAKLGYTHLISTAKRNVDIETKIKQRLISEDSNFYEKHFKI